VIRDTVGCGMSPTGVGSDHAVRVVEQAEAATQSGAGAAPLHQLVLGGGRQVGKQDHAARDEEVDDVLEHADEAEAVWPPTLSMRELEVARAVSEGLTNKEVAWRLGITERTVKAHLGAVFDKFGVRDRLQLALRLAGRAGAETVGQP